MKEETNYFEMAKSLHLRHARITFEEIKETDDTLTVRVVQTQSPQNNHATKNRLEEIVQELYAVKEDFNKKLIVHAVPYVPYPFEHITDKWIRSQMTVMKIGLKGMSVDMGINKIVLSNLINGHKQLDEFSRPLFHFYFLSKPLNH